MKCYGCGIARKNEGFCSEVCFRQALRRLQATYKKYVKLRPR